MRPPWLPNRPAPAPAPTAMRTAAAAPEPEPPLMMVPAKPCPCEAMEALLRDLGEPESDNWLEHFAQEDRRVIPALRALGFTEAASQIVADHAAMRKQIRATGQPDVALLSRHAAFEDALVKQLGERIRSMRTWHQNEHRYG